MGVQRRLGDAGLAGDGIHAGGAIAVGHEQVDGGVDDLADLGIGGLLVGQGGEGRCGHRFRRFLSI